MKQPRSIIDAVILNDSWELLVVDKLKWDNTVLTILPGWKLEASEDDIQCLVREIKEELWITLNETEFWKK